jgi:NAD(P)H-flavin reductase
MGVPQKLRCHVDRIVDHGEKVYTLELLPERPVPRFRSGQFLHLALDEYEPSGFWPESRVFSIASSPEQRDRLRIVYSVRGRFTARIAQELSVGRHVWVKLPYGDFVIDAIKDVALFAGGTGITAFTAFLESLPPSFDKRLYIFYGARKPALLLFRPFLEKLRSVVRSVCLYYCVEELAGAPENDLHVGRLSVEAAWPLIQAPETVNYYLSGPPLMLQTLSQGLIKQGVSSAAVKIDSW